MAPAVEPSILTHIFSAAELRDLGLDQILAERTEPVAHLRLRDFQLLRDSILLLVCGNILITIASVYLVHLSAGWSLSLYFGYFCMSLLVAVGDYVFSRKLAFTSPREGESPVLTVWVLFSIVATFLSFLSSYLDILFLAYLQPSNDILFIFCTTLFLFCTFIPKYVLPIRLLFALYNRADTFTVNNPLQFFTSFSLSKSLIVMLCLPIRLAHFIWDAIIALLPCTTQMRAWLVPRWLFKSLLTILIGILVATDMILRFLKRIALSIRGGCMRVAMGIFSRLRPTPACDEETDITGQPKEALLAVSHMYREFVSPTESLTESECTEYTVGKVERVELVTPSKLSDSTEEIQEEGILEGPIASLVQSLHEQFGSGLFESYGDARTPRGEFPRAQVSNTSAPDMKDIVCISKMKLLQLTLAANLSGCYNVQLFLKTNMLPADVVETVEFTSTIAFCCSCFGADLAVSVVRFVLLTINGADFLILAAASASSLHWISMFIYEAVFNLDVEDWIIGES